MRSHDTYSIIHDTHAPVGVHALLLSGLGVFDLSGLAQMPTLPRQNSKGCCISALA
jgi:hypothetical protein